jgi:hypothetical protein
MGLLGLAAIKPEPERRRRPARKKAQGWFGQREAGRV